MQKYHDEPKQYKGYLKSALESPSGVVSSAFANPKSNTLTVPSSLTLMLAGLRSR